MKKVPALPPRAGLGFDVTSTLLHSRPRDAHLLLTRSSALLPTLRGMASRGVARLGLDDPEFSCATLQHLHISLIDTLAIPNAPRNLHPTLIGINSTSSLYCVSHSCRALTSMHLHETKNAQFCDLVWPKPSLQSLHQTNGFQLETAGRLPSDLPMHL